MNRNIALYLGNKDLKSLANSLWQFRNAAVEELIKRELVYYKKTKLDDMEKRLIICAKLGMTDWVLKYIKSGVDVNVSLNVRNHQLQAIHYAALSGVLSCVKLLVKNGAILFPQEPSRFFLSPLHFADANGNPDMAEYFVDLGVPVDQESPDCFWLGSHSTPLQIAAYHKKTDCVARLILKGADVHHIKKNGSQPIHVAVVKPDNTDVITLLLNAKANPNAKTPNGVTPMMQAMQIFECGANIQALLSGGANPREPNVCNHYMLPLQHLISNRLMPAVIILLNFDPTLIDAVVPPPTDFENPVCWQGDRTALHIAVMLDYENEVKFLLEHNASTDIKTHAGKKAIDLLVTKDGLIAKLLEEKQITQETRQAEVKDNFVDATRYLL
jgi:ankyrin repeat protein